MTKTLKNLLRGILWAWRSHFAKSEKEALLAALYRVKFTTFKRRGICEEFSRHYRADGHCGEDLRRLFKLWPKFSGHSVYPVPGGYTDFWRAAGTRRMWSGEYGNLRKELLNFMIEQLEKELAE